MTTPSAKILKDFNGNIWLVTLSDNLPITYYSEVGMGFARVDFNWSEIGDADDGRDLYDNNFVKLRLISISYNPLESSEELSVEFSTMIKSLNGISDLAFLIDKESSRALRWKWHRGELADNR